MSGKLKIERKPCERPNCALFGQVHPRCKAYACYRHGGKASNSIAFARRRQALDAVKSHVSRIVAYDGGDVTSPEEGLLMEVKWSGQVAVAYGEACEALIADEALTTKSAGAPSWAGTCERSYIGRGGRPRSLWRFVQVGHDLYRRAGCREMNLGGRTPALTGRFAVGVVNIGWS
jgi:hypothetical protein